VAGQQRLGEARKGVAAGRSHVGQGRAVATGATCLENAADVLAAVASDPAAVSVIARISVPAGAACAEIAPAIEVPLTIVAVRERLGQDTLLEMVLNSLHSRAR